MTQSKHAYRHIIQPYFLFVAGVVFGTDGVDSCKISESSGSLALTGIFISGFGITGAGLAAGAVTVGLEYMHVYTRD